MRFLNSIAVMGFFAIALSSCNVNTPDKPLVDEKKPASNLTGLFNMGYKCP